MANAPFKLRSGNKSSFKMMGSSPAKQTEDGVPRKKQSVVSEDYKKTYDTGPVKGPEDSDVMNIIKKRKQSGPQDSEENKQKEIDKLVEKRDKTAGSEEVKSVAKPKKDWKKTEEKEKEVDKKKKEKVDKTVDQHKRDEDGKIIKEDKSIIDKVTDKVKNIYNKVTSEESVNKRNKKKKRRDKKEKKEKDLAFDRVTKGPFHPDNM